MKKLCCALCAALLFAAGCSSADSDIKNAEETVKKDVEDAVDESTNITNISDEENEISTIMADLKDLGYTAKSSADVDEMISLSDLESVVEMEKDDAECTIYQFYTSDEANETFDAIIKHVKASTDKKIVEKDNMISETDLEDNEVDYYIKKDRLIIKTENISNAEELFKQWNLSE